MLNRMEEEVSFEAQSRVFCDSEQKGDCQRLSATHSASQDTSREVLVCLKRVSRNAQEGKKEWSLKDVRDVGRFRAKGATHVTII